MNPYDLLNALVTDVARSPAAYTSLITSEPNHKIPLEQRRQLEARSKAINEWEQITLNLFRASLLGDTYPEIAEAFFHDTPPHLIAYHRNLLAETPTTTPLFIRTDESVLGKIVEINAPGGCWGFYEILQDYYRDRGYLVGEPLSKRWVEAARTKTIKQPVVHQFLDNLSHPPSERYFAVKKRRYAPHFAWDAGIRWSDCNLIRGHVYSSLLNDRFFAERRRAWIKGALHYDLPPLAIWRQKVPMALPFWRLTRDYYSDEIRDLFPYTVFIDLSGFDLPDGDHITIDQFCALPKGRRKFYLKYAGADIEKDWGGKGVYNLQERSRIATARLLDYVLNEKACYVVQQSYPSSSIIEYISKDGEPAQADMHNKFSCFYGPTGMLAILSMHRTLSKVGGSDDTVMNICL